jgi:hypothetical protein
MRSSVAVVVLLAGSFTTAAPPFDLIINEDNSHFFGSRQASDMTLDGLNAFVDQYADTKVTHLFLSPNSMRASYASNVFDRIWDVGGQVVPADQPVANAWVNNARILHEKGLDPYSIWIARCREKGISPWLSMRMNDVHDVDNLKSYIVSTFWLKHPEYWRVPGSTTGGWIDRAFDYGIPEVREYHMNIVRELLERYDPDGLELDWMRFGWHFAPGKEKEGALLLTQFMRDVRTLANEWSAKRGHPIQIGARVPFSPEAAVGLGMDGVAWAKEGLIDLLVPTPFWATADFDIPVERWHEQLGNANAKVTIAPGTEVLLRASPGGKQVLNDLASLYGWTASAWQRGGEAIYLFNYMDPAPILGDAKTYRQILERGLSHDVVSAGSCRFVVTYHDTVPIGMSSGAQLPKTLKESPELTLYIAPLEKSSKVIVVAGWAGVQSPKSALAQLNGVNAPAISMDVDREPLGGVESVSCFQCDSAAMKLGNNVVRITGSEQDKDAQLVWLEIRK